MSNISSRNHSEKRFQFYGKVAVTLAISFLVILLYNIFSTGISAEIPVENILYNNITRKLIARVTATFP